MALAEVLKQDFQMFELDKIEDLGFHDFQMIIQQGFQLRLSQEARVRIQASHTLLLRKLENKEFRIYGVNTGFGQNAKMFLDESENELLQNNLIEYLDCAQGEMTSYKESKLTLLFRIINFLPGRSGVSLNLVESLITLFNHNLIPVIPEEGSLGASGDLIPLAAIGSVLAGRGECYEGNQDSIISGEAALKECCLEPMSFQQKDALGLVNGTSMMSAKTYLHLLQLEQVVETVIDNTGFLFKTLGLNLSFLSENVHEKAKNHRGQVKVAKTLRELADCHKNVEHHSLGSNGLQDKPMQYPYSLRCVPQIIGPLYDFLGFAKEICLTEILSVNDNPIVSVEDQQVYSGGNFYGSHIALINDGLKGPIAQIASLIDRQVLLLCDDRTNFDMPMNLAAREKLWDHGLKGFHQYCSSLLCELTSSLSVTAAHTRSTETHNQDIISLGTHSARQVGRVLEQLKKMTKIHSIVTARVGEIQADKKIPQRLKNISFKMSRLGQKQILNENDLFFVAGGL